MKPLKIAAVACVFVALTATPASADSYETTISTPVDGYNVCVDLPNTDIGTRVIVARCVTPNGNLSQRWRRTGSTEVTPQYFNIYNVYTGKCMDIGPAPAHNVVMSNCNWSTSTSQRWSLQNQSEIGTQLRNNATGTCLDWGADGNPVVVATCQGSYRSQRWYGHWL